MSNKVKYTKEIINEAKKMRECGYSYYKIAKELKLPRNVANYWGKKNFQIEMGNRNIHEYDKNGDIVLDIKTLIHTEDLEKNYCYCLAVYLCDGHINNMKHKPDIYRIRFFNDMKYPVNTKCWADSLQKILKNNKVTVYKPKNRNVNIVVAYSKILPILFPQHGKGEKWERKLDLKEWQIEIIKKYPEQFIKGCIESDGSIYTQNIKDFQYKKYNFTQKSENITDWFLWCLNLKGIKKNKYFHKTRKVFLVQNFKKEQILILESIIKKKE